MRREVREAGASKRRHSRREKSWKADIEARAKQMRDKLVEPDHVALLCPGRIAVEGLRPRRHQGTRRALRLRKPR